MLWLQKAEEEKKEAEQVFERCFESSQRTNYIRRGIFLGLTIAAEGLAREYSVMPLSSVFAYGHHWRQDTVLGRPECAYCQLVPF